MSIHLEFKSVRNSEAVTTHVHELFRELIQITEDRFAFHVSMSKLNEQHQVHINCTYNQKKLASSAEHVNLYKALSKGVDAMRTQVIRKSERVRAA